MVYAPVPCLKIKEAKKICCVYYLHEPFPEIFLIVGVPEIKGSFFKDTPHNIEFSGVRQKQLVAIQWGPCRL